ncbi:MAG TPA: iron-containing redox enzyme family protein [Acidimicrobiales bacterium]|nr:iron-containing redox enzyme family protein [Acidimicrobiales bacterium]
MNSSSAASMARSALDGKRLLSHPFYQRWEKGEVGVGELSAYAAQYRHFERFLPEFLGALAESLPPGGAREMVAANLADELGDPIPHVELLERFAGAVGAPDAAPSPAMNALIALYKESLAEGAAQGLAAFAAYECQSAEVAATKAEGLRNNYGLDEHGVSFWAHHAKADVTHAEWALEALASTGVAPELLAPSVRRAAQAWWAFLDEREQARPAA